ncbi:MAG TPA: NADH-quinone oxidoreductase subunit NuoB [Propionicimonas sp.]|nr:NADH-quinone oxidoreductase subunit NuoB [Propionicimonas sp.]
MSLLGKIRRTGRVAEPALPPPGEDPRRAEGSVDGRFRGSIQVRHVDAGSCNGCEIEIASAFGPVYDLERYGVRLVASPRHADVLLVTGPVTHNMRDPLLKAYEAMPAPKWVVALGDCARDCGVFAGAYGVFGAVSDVVPVDVSVPGCPPSPEAIITALRGLRGR